MNEFAKVMERLRREDPAGYVRLSILYPNVFVAPGFPDVVMPQNMGEVFTEGEINDLVAYVLSLSAE